MKCRGCDNEFSPRNERDYYCGACLSKRGRRSKRKGAANELRFAKYLQDRLTARGFKYRVKRTPRSGGIHEFEPADIFFLGAPSESLFKRFHIENKNTAQWDIPGWMADAVKKDQERGLVRMPMLVIRHPNEHEEYVVLRIEDWVELLVRFERLTVEPDNE